MDAFIAAMGQFSISASVQLQRRTFEFAMRNGYNMQCALTPPSALSLLIAVVCECRLEPRFVEVIARADGCRL